MTTQAMTLQAFDVSPALVKQGKQALYRRARVVYDPARGRIRVWIHGAANIKLAADYAVDGGHATSTASWIVNVGNPVNLMWHVYRAGRLCKCAGGEKLREIDPWEDPA